MAAKQTPRRQAGGQTGAGSDTSGTTVAAGGLTVPDVTGLDVLSAALAYTQAGWYVLPVGQGTKRPLPELGSDWQHKSSRDPEVIAAWLAGTGHGIALHAGRSGAVIIDVDHPEKVPPVLAQAISDLRPPFQSTRPGTPARGHAVFACPPGRMFSNSTGKLGKGWGEVRGANGVIVVAPSLHPDSGCYHWERTGAVPELPAELAELLTDAQPAEDAATDAEVAAFLAAHTRNSRPWLLTGVLSSFKAKTGAGESRHETAVGVTVWAAKEARAGFYPAAVAFDGIGALFGQALNGDRPAASEYAGIIAWAVGQANGADLDEVRRIAERNDARPFHLGSTPLSRIAAFITQLRTWLDLPDPRMCCSPSPLRRPATSTANRCGCCSSPSPPPEKPKRSGSSTNGQTGGSTR
jgi:hypothetical protein